MRMPTGGTFGTSDGYFVSLYMTRCITDKRSGVTTTAMIITLRSTRGKGTGNNVRTGVICIGEIYLVIIIGFNCLKTLA